MQFAATNEKDFGILSATTIAKGAEMKTLVTYTYPSTLVQAYEQAGRLEDAIAEYHRAIPLTGEDVKSATQFSDDLMLAFKAEGPEGYWKKRFQLGTRTSPLDKAASYIRLGQRKEAFEELNEAFSKHDMWLTALKVDPRWDMLRSDPSFEQLLKRVGLK
jgi:tetratricopeptide (TPR) repeat protein